MAHKKVAQESRRSEFTFLLLDGDVEIRDEQTKRQVDYIIINLQLVAEPCNEPRTHTGIIILLSELDSMI